VREILIALLLGLPAVAVASSLWFARELQTLLREVPKLESTRDLERYRSVVARQMIAALVQIAPLGAPVVLFAFGLVSGALGPSEIAYVIVPSLVVLVVAARTRAVEKAVQRLPAASEELARERDRIVHTWLKKPLPDW